MLFERLGRALRLTDEELVLLQDAPPLLAAAGQIQERFGAHDTVQGTIRLGVPEAFAVVCLPNLIDLLSREHPALRLELDIATSWTLTQRVEDLHVDLAFAAAPEENPASGCFPSISTSSAESRMRSSGRRPWSDRPTCVACRSSATRTRRRSTGQSPTGFRSAGLEPILLSFCNSVSVIAHLVATGVAISVLPLPMVHEVAAGRLKTLTRRPRIANLFIYACYGGLKPAPTSTRSFAQPNRCSATCPSSRPCSTTGWHQGAAVAGYQ